MKRPEQQLQKAVTAFLKVALPSEAFFTAIPLGGGGRIRGAMLKATGTVRGVPDLMVIYRGRAIFVELKSKRGALNDAQKQTIPALMSAGAPVFLCRSVEEVARDLCEAGIPLRASLDNRIGGE